MRPFSRNAYNPRAPLPPDHPVHPFDRNAQEFARGWLAHVEAGRIGGALLSPSSAGRGASAPLGFLA